MEHFHPDLNGLYYGGGDASSQSTRGVDRKMASPVTYKVTLPRDYNPDRLEPYPMLIVVPADAGFGGAMGESGGTSAVSSLVNPHPEPQSQTLNPRP